MNFASVNGGVINLRTYERGVEDETLACGTGAVATAIAAHDKGLVTAQSVPVEALGGSLRVDFSFAEGRYSKVWLTGPAEWYSKAHGPTCKIYCNYHDTYEHDKTAFGTPCAAKSRT